MTFAELNMEWHGLTRARKLEAVDKMFKMIMGDMGSYENFLIEVIDMAVYYEQGDYFGTEGARL